MIGAETQNRKS